MQKNVIDENNIEEEYEKLDLGSFMKIHEKYLEALKSFDDYITVSQWAEKVGELYPDVLEKANQEAQNQKNDTTGLREIAARISSRLSTGGFDSFIKIDNSERPRRVKYITEEESKEELEEELEDVNINLTKKEAEKNMNSSDKYRLNEFYKIRDEFKEFYNIHFEVDHAKALKNKKNRGVHHPDNFQLLTKYHNGQKSNNNWKRFSIDEQVEYINKTIELQIIISSRIDIKIDEVILNSLLDRLKQVYN
ncbi:HNH endonuclease [Arcobacter sp. LA11]|uniref:HNH endonuclease n=1 Tax=Arcobacter sp. LA11 TaxID=1898176 RepID=UPI002159D94E|nr:HNH endonuclease [Arcobacter sp. LA11]